MKKSLDRRIPAMLLYVLESSGSSPGRQGFFMAINAIGEMTGSIGGGIMEHKFVDMAREKLKTGQDEPGIRKQIHDKAAGKNQSGMICSGEQSILLYTVRQKDLETIQRIIASLENNENGTIELSPGQLYFSSTVPENNFEYFFQADDNWLYREKTGYKNQLTVIGGGHCSLALCMLMRSMDFYIRLYDDRSGLKTMEENNFAHEKQVVEDYSNLTSRVRPGPGHYVVIMTFGYRTDEIALSALVDKEFSYLGVLGSQTKIKKMLAGLREKGVNETWVRGIHAPIGIAIRSQTPEEIAISIAAEIIGIKNKQV